MEVFSQKGKKKFYSNGYCYVFDRLSACGTKEFWRCELKNNGCKNRIHTSDGVIIKELHNHSHDSNVAKAEADIVRSKIKIRAGETMEKTSQVINVCLNEANLSQAAQVVLPKNATLKKMVRRKRNEINAAPPTPLRIEDLIIPEEYRTLITNGMRENFLLADSGPESDRILIFGRERNIQEILLPSKHWYVDGTFSTAPQFFHQVYVVLAERFGGVHPVAYVLLPNKQSATYTRMLGLLKNLEPNLNPQKISCDFELAAINAFKDAFPNAEILGCLFHLTKNFRKHLGEHQLLGQYNNDADFAVQARMITSLAFVPIEDLDTAIDELSHAIPSELEPVLQWFEDYYVGRPNRRGNGRRPAVFKPELWSVYNRVLNDTDRTNNHAEAAHRRLQTELSMDHPSIWKLIESLKIIQRSRDMFFEQLVAGSEPPQKRRKYALADARIKNIVEDYNNRNIVEFLRGISYNYEMNP